jgi:hypothetical protein
MLENCTYVSIQLTLCMNAFVLLQSPLGEEWQAKYGPTFKFPGLLGASGQVDLASTNAKFLDFRAVICIPSTPSPYSEW